MNLLSIQSHVAYGHAGNSAAVFPLQRIGVEVWPVHTVQFSNHTGYGDWGGRAFDAELIREVVAGIEARGVFGECDGVLSGYLGSAKVGEAVLDAARRVKAANPSARYICDPVIGSAESGVFVSDDAAEFIRDKAVPAADVVTPNQFELDYLSGRTTRSLADALAAIEAIRARGPRVVAVTSVLVDNTPEGSLDNLVADEKGCFRVRTPRLGIVANGAGDTMAGLFVAHLLRTGTPAEALARTVSSLFGVLKRTVEAGSREMLLIVAQDEFVEPTESFVAEPVGPQNTARA